MAVNLFIGGLGVSKYENNVFTLEDPGAIKRNLGLYKKEQESDKFLKALADPAAYLGERNDAKKKINKELTKQYGLYAFKLYEKGYPEKEAKAMAKERYDRMKKEEYALFHTDYPLNVGNYAKQLQLKKVKDSIN